MIKEYKFDCPYCDEILESFNWECKNISDGPLTDTVGTEGVLVYLVDSTSWFDSIGVTWSFKNLLFRNWTFEKAWNICKNCGGESFIPVFAKPDTQNRKLLFNLLEFYPGDRVKCHQKQLKGADLNATIIFSELGSMRFDGLVDCEGGLKIIYLDPIPDGALFFELPATFDAISSMLKNEDFVSHKFSLIGSILSIKEFLMHRFDIGIGSRLRIFKWRIFRLLSSFKNKNRSFENELGSEDSPF